MALACAVTQNGQGSFQATGQSRNPDRRGATEWRARGSRNMAPRQGGARNMLCCRKKTEAPMSRQARFAMYAALRRRDETMGNARPGGGPKDMGAKRRARRNGAMRAAKPLGLSGACLFLPSLPPASAPKDHPQRPIPLL